MAVFNTKIFDNIDRGASILEVLMSMAIVAIAIPLVYSQIAETNTNIRDMAIARNITNLRADVLNFVRLNQDTWPDVAQIRMSEEDLNAISDGISTGFIDKYLINGTSVTDVYLGFKTGSTNLHTANIAHHIGGDAAVVDSDGIAYGRTWAVSAPDFNTGDLIYRITRNVTNEDKTKYLHRGSSGEDDLNVMLRDLSMGGYNIYDIGGVFASALRIKDVTSTFITTNDLTAQTIYFSNGANMAGNNVSIKSLRVTDDIIGFRNIYADKLNTNGYSTSGRIITDRATVTNSVNVATNFNLKSGTTATISGFTGIKTGAVYTAFLLTDEIRFLENFGLTVSGELMMSTNSPIKFGTWLFPSTTPPSFDRFTLGRASIPALRSTKSVEFGPLMTSGWQEYIPANYGLEK